MPEPRPGRHGRTGRAARIAGGLAPLALAAACLPAHGTAAPLATGCWRIDPEHSEVRFHLVALGAINLHGRFERLSGRAWQRGPAAPIEVLVEVDAGSLTMSSARYQAWARSPEFFDVERHPRVVFRSRPLPSSLFEGGGQLAGWLTVRGIRRPVDFLLRAPGCADPDRPCTLRVEGEIRRTAFGMRTRRMTLSDRVALDQRLAVVPDPDGCRDLPDRAAD